MKTSTRASSFIRQFPGTDNHEGIVCAPFHLLVHAQGCPFRCQYCFLQTTPSFVFRSDWLKGLLYANYEDMLAELDEWLLDPVAKMLMVGELMDGLAFDSAYAHMSGKPLTQWLVPRFAAQDRHRAVILTKSTLIRHALELKPTPQVVFSWSVNAEEASRRWEIGAPPPSERFAAAATMKKAGWPVRLRLDPMIPYEGWQKGYAEAIDRINALAPELVTIGALRATNAKSLRTRSRKNGRDDGSDSVFDFLTEEKDPSAFKYRIPPEKQREMFRFALDRLAPTVVPALCKEDRTLWNDLGMRFRGCHCLLGAADALVAGRTGAPFAVQV